MNRLLNLQERDKQRDLKKTIQSFGGAKTIRKLPKKQRLQVSAHLAKLTDNRKAREKCKESLRRIEINEKLEEIEEYYEKVAHDKAEGKWSLARIFLGHIIESAREIGDTSIEDRAILEYLECTFLEDIRLKEVKHDEVEKLIFNPSRLERIDDVEYFERYRQKEEEFKRKAAINAIVYILKRGLNVSRPIDKGRNSRGQIDSQHYIASIINEVGLNENDLKEVTGKMIEFYLPDGKIGLAMETAKIYGSKEQATSMKNLYDFI
jgi:hypothetical protein